uniref:Uncharacterized protein n=1 Tax=Anguilla anguilla TaxID=7936 RepID=A0A0E9PX13_ANGAN
MSSWFLSVIFSSSFLVASEAFIIHTYVCLS